MVRHCAVWPGQPGARHLRGAMSQRSNHAASSAQASHDSALAATGYMFPLVKGTEVVAGALLLADRYVPLALLFLAPIVLNIVAYHGILAPAGVALPLILTAAGSYLAWVHRARFAAVLQAMDPVGAAPASASGKVVASAAE